MKTINGSKFHEQDSGGGVECELRTIAAGGLQGCATMTVSVKRTHIEDLKAAYDAAGERLTQAFDTRIGEAHKTGTRCLSGDFAACNAARSAYEKALRGES